MNLSTYFLTLKHFRSSFQRSEPDPKRLLRLLHLQRFSLRHRSIRRRKCDRLFDRQSILPIEGRSSGSCGFQSQAGRRL